MADTLAAADFETLLDALRRRGYRCVGPTVRDGAIVYGELHATGDLPVGQGDEQAPGSYRLTHRGDEALFGYAVGPHSWKQELLPPRLRLWQARRENGGLAIEEEAPAAERTAFVGVRPCELAAIAIQDRVLLGGRFPDRDYAARRADVFVVAVECGTPSPLCFCGALGTGPGASDGFDLALTELLEDHRFLVRAGSTAGDAVLAELPTQPATREDVDAAGLVVARATRETSDRFEPEGVHDLLLRNLESPAWDDVAARCLMCGNCTLVCPTCFCTQLEDTSTLDGTTASRERVWDTCFSLRYAEMHGGNTRPSPRARYRQWLTHKLATWEDQFGTAGCVGCGRCIAWCPVGIDIRREVEAVRRHDTVPGTEEDTHAHA